MPIAMSTILFEDAAVSRLYPVTVSRPAFQITCGGYRLVDVASRLGMRIDRIVRPHLRALAQADAPPHFPWTDRGGSRTLLVNARMVPSVAAGQRLKELIERDEPSIVRQGDAVAAASLPRGTAPPATDVDPNELLAYLRHFPLRPVELDLPLFEYPHDIVRHHLAIMGDSLQYRLTTGSYQEVAEGVFVAPGARLGQYTVTDTKAGPIVLESDAQIGPHCYLRGPVHVGCRTRVIEHAAIKDHVVLGHTTKIGGEVEGSVIEPFTNKQHHGFLGHSYLGSWINLGAGTCNSDLKNTYGQVNMEYDGRKVPTGMQFIGCIIGDYSKSAINTGIFTGKTVGTCSMMYGFITTNVPSFVNYARLFGQVTEASVDVMVSAQERMFARRKVAQRPCDIQLLHDMFELTRHERQLAGAPLAL
jgi:UDP-N-acetylglucosamine diphosphorylase / glucose-1-phosphate thymidylyltransferase / UDP-N-acetylgalactosamine diphosphorylase / glucosamine-1-phosphate N-acetyltransferase / galactosamine-1-phosphate N-acetyltransferase